MGVYERRDELDVLVVSVVMSSLSRMSGLYISFSCLERMHVALKAESRNAGATGPMLRWNSRKCRLVRNYPVPSGRRMLQNLQGSIACHHPPTQKPRKTDHRARFSCTATRSQSFSRDTAAPLAGYSVHAKSVLFACHFLGMNVLVVQCRTLHNNMPQKYLASYLGSLISIHPARHRMFDGSCM